MTKIVAVAASLLVNASLVLAFARIGHVPDGEVYISYAGEPVAAFTQASTIAPHERRTL